MPTPHVNELKDIKSDYLVDAFTGSQVRIFIGDIYVDNLLSIQWDATQSKSPIYGYNSVEFDYVMKGNFLVQGSFAIIFTEMAYLELIRRATTGEFDNVKDEEKRILMNSGRTNGIEPGELPIYGNLSRPGPLSAYYKNENTNVVSPIASYNTIRDILRYQKWSMSKYEDYAEVLEDLLWNGALYDSIMEEDSHNAKQSIAKWDKEHKRIRRADENDYYYDQIDNLAYILSDTNNLFNITLLYGDVNNPASEHTVKNIFDVHITGSSQAITTDDAVVETYTFFAKNVDVKIGNIAVPKLLHNLRTNDSTIASTFSVVKKSDDIWYKIYPTYINNSTLEQINIRAKPIPNVVREKIFGTLKSLTKADFIAKLNQYLNSGDNSLIGSSLASKLSSYTVTFYIRLGDGNTKTILTKEVSL